MRKILEIALREYVETIRTKMFLIGLFVVPAVMVGAILLTARFIVQQPKERPAVRVGVTCPSEALLGFIKTAFDAYNMGHSRSPLRLDTVHVGEETGKNQLRQHEMDLYVTLEGDLAEESGRVRLYSFQPKPSQLDSLWTVENLLRSAIEDYRCQVKGLDREQLRKLRVISLEQIELGSEAGREHVQNQGNRAARMMVPFAFMYLIFIGMLAMGQHMLSSIIEEKNSRIIEVLLSVVSPFELMAGKILGLAGLGMTVTVIWGSAAYGAARYEGMEIGIGASLAVCFFVYYVLGFLLYCALVCGAGSICNTMKESQSLMMPVTLLLIIPLMLWPALVQDPNGALARGLSFIPPITPMLMILRLSSGADVSVLETAATILLLAVSVVGAIWVASKIFRTGILMYGKRPGLREVARWLLARG
jgi:ABC-2 type transport system permease protein